jgi:hypothetical protein
LVLLWNNEQEVWMNLAIHHGKMVTTWKKGIRQQYM